MKRIMLLGCLLWGICSGSYAQTGFKITGRLGGNLSGKLILLGSGSGGAVNLGETEMTNGSFEFAGKVDEMMAAYIMTEEQQPVATLMLENLPYLLVAGENGIDIQGGGESQQVLNKFEDLNRQIMQVKMVTDQQMKAARARQNQLQLETLEQQFNRAMQEISTRQQELFQTYKDSPASAFFIASGMEQMDYASLQGIFNTLGESARTCFFGEVIAQRLAAMKRVEIGSVAPDFKGATLNDDTLSLYGIKAKLKLVDFWASWCGPCRQEMPNVYRIYKKYKAQGLEIIGVSLDTQKQDWAKTLTTDKMTWPNISDLKGWKSDIAALYFVRGIPCTLLLDADNRIVAKNLRGRELEKKIAELLKD